MKTLSRIHLHNLSQAELAKREENWLKGGAPCVCVSMGHCPCTYADPDSFILPDEPFDVRLITAANDDANFFHKVMNDNHG